MHLELHWHTQFYKKKKNKPTTGLEGKDPNTLVVGDFNTPLLLINRFLDKTLKEKRRDPRRQLGYGSRKPKLCDDSRNLLEMLELCVGNSDCF
jgi:hypothetical protein